MAARMDWQSLHTAQNWALVAQHADIHTFLILMSTCRELYHNLPLALPKWHFKHRFQLSAEDHFSDDIWAKENSDLAAKDVDFATCPYMHNREWLVERFFAFAYLGVRVDARLPLLRCVRDDPRLHSTVRVVVPDNEDIVTALKDISGSGSSGGSDSTAASDLNDSGLGTVDMDMDDDGDGDGVGNGDDDVGQEDMAAAGVLASQATDTAVAAVRSVARGPATVSWGIDIRSDQDVEQLKRRLAAVANATTVDTLRLYVLNDISRLAVRDVRQLVLDVTDGPRIGRLETTNVHTVRIVGHLCQRTLEGECRGLDTVQLALVNNYELERVPAFAGARNVQLARLHELSDLSPFRDAHDVTLIYSCGVADLNVLQNVRTLNVHDSATHGTGKLELPHAHEISMAGISFSQPTQLHCPKATRLKLEDVRRLTQVVAHPHLRHLAATPNILPVLQVDHVQETHVTVFPREVGGGLSEKTAMKCQTIEQWRHITRTLQVTIWAMPGEVTLVDPPNITAAARAVVDMRSGDTAPRHLPGTLLSAMSAYAALEANNAAAPGQQSCFPTLTQPRVSRLELVDMNLHGCTIEGVDEVAVHDGCSGRVMVRDAKRVEVSGSKCLNVTVEDSEEAEVGSVGTLAKVSGVKVCRLVGGFGSRIGSVENVRSLQLRGVVLPRTTLQDVAQFGCQFLRVDNLKLLHQYLSVSCTSMWKRAAEERLVTLWCRSEPLEPMRRLW